MLFLLSSVRRLNLRLLLIDQPVSGLQKDGNVKIDFCTSRSHPKINKLPITVCMND